MSDTDYITIATRKSPLALWQANHIKLALETAYPNLTVKLLGLTTEGDKHLEQPLTEVGGKGLFVKALEDAILDGKADIAVHSLKDVPAEFPAGLGISTVCSAEDPSDAFVSRNYQNLSDLPPGAEVGTSSLRRQCQLKALRPDLNTVNLRGNVGTRLEKLDRGEYDAIILASAGLKRLGLAHRITQRFDPQLFLPAVGQGVLAIECRLDDNKTRDRLTFLDDPLTRYRVQAERAFNQRLQGGCQVPVAAHAVIHASQLTLIGLVGKIDGSEMLRTQNTGKITEAEIIGVKTAEELLARGADKILREIHEQHR